MQLWRFARYDLHLSDEEFYSLTPRHYDHLCRRHKRATEANELLFGQLTSWVINTGFRSFDKPTSPIDYMPSQWTQKASGSHMAPTSTKPKRMTAKRRADVARTLRGLFPPR